MDDCSGSRHPHECEDTDTSCRPLSLLDTGRLRETKTGNYDEEDGDGDVYTSRTEVAKVSPNAATNHASSKQDSFPQFCLLPIELRTLIWEHFCPDLSRKSSRAICLELVKIAPMTYTVLESKGLDKQTQALRVVMATHHESRELALGFFPDTYKIRDGTGEVRYSSDRDKMALRFRLRNPLLVNKSLENKDTVKKDDLEGSDY
ncbi:hypothetical protein Hte_004284 [Hypoxylon texense]